MEKKEKSGSCQTGHPQVDHVIERHGKLNGGFVSWTKERSDSSRLVMTFAVHTVDCLAEKHGASREDNSGCEDRKSRQSET